jgi:cystathionine beta-lyase/cystathionine gamma-synthase
MSQTPITTPIVSPPSPSADAATAVQSSNLDTTLQQCGKSHRVGSGLVGATETSVTFRTMSTSAPPIYSRLGNTENHLETESMLARIHSADAAIVTGSGMAAFNLIFQSLLSPGDHVLVQECCYGGTYNLLTKILGRWGVVCTYAPIKDWPKTLNKRTKLAVFESISNPFCIPQDLGMAVDFCRKHDVISLCDNTFASPVLCQPLCHGVDLVLESATKYLNGHSDVIAGMIAGRQSLLAQLRPAHAYLGTFIPNRECALLTRGLRTLTVRMERHTKTGACFAKDMQRAQDVVRRVYYGTPDNDSAARFFPNGYGGMVAVEFHPDINVKAMMRTMTLVSDVPSLGGTESSATIPAYTTNWFMTPQEKLSLGITESLVRFSIGLENPEEISQDVLAAARASLP